MQNRPWEPTFGFLERKQASTPGCKKRGQNSTTALNEPARRDSGKEISAEDQETKQAVAKKREGRVDQTLVELELTSHGSLGSLWEAGNPDCWSGGIISFYVSLPGEDGQEPASLPRSGWTWGKHLEHLTSVLIRHRKRMFHGPQSNLSRGASELPERKGLFSPYFIL